MLHHIKGNGHHVYELLHSNPPQLKEAVAKYMQLPDEAGASALISVVGRVNKDLEASFNIYHTFINHLSKSQLRPSGGVFKALLQACYSCNQPSKGLALFETVFELVGKNMDDACLGIMLNLCKETADSNYVTKIFYFVTTTMVNASTSSCTKLIKLLSKFNLLQEIRVVWTYMEQRKIQPDAVTYSTLFFILSKSRDLHFGSKIHAHMEQASLQSPQLKNMVSISALMDMYVKCNQPYKVISMWEELCKSITKFNSIVSILTHNTYSLTTKVYSIVLHACIISKSCAVGARVHQHIISSEAECDRHLVQLLKTMYTVCGKADMAGNIDSTIKIQSPSVSTTPRPETRPLQVKEAPYVIAQQPNKQIKPLPTNINPVSPFSGSGATVVELCKTEKHREALDVYKRNPDIAGATVLIRKFSELGDLSTSLSIYDIITKIQSPTIAVYRAVLSACKKAGNAQKAIDLWEDMRHYSVLPDNACFGMVAITCAELGNLAVASNLLHLWKSNVLGFDLQEVHCVMLIKALSKQRNVTLLADIWQQSQATGMKLSEQLISAFLLGCTRVGTHAISLGEELDSLIAMSEFSSNTKVTNSLIKMYAKCGRPSKALELYDKCMLRQKFTLDTHIYGLLACAELGASALKAGQKIHQFLEAGRLATNTLLCNVLINMYAKCGAVDSAENIFWELETKILLSPVSWNILLSCYAYFGRGTKAIALFDQMREKGVQLDRITFVHLLTACSHAGLADEALWYYDNMKTEFGVNHTPDHHACIIDALGRKNRLDEAEHILNSLPPSERDIVCWKTLLGACRIQNDLVRAQQIASKALEIDPTDASVYVMLSNIYAANKKWAEVAKIREDMRTHNARKIPGEAIVEVDGIIHTFIIHDETHPAMPQIREKWAQLNTRLRTRAGYEPNIAWVLKSQTILDKEEDICKHSEKMAICFALISTPPHAPIFVTKNLRVCGDCHVATALISKVENRKIVVRDAARYHTFEHGKCDCGGFW